MKAKMLVAMALSSLFAVSIGYAEPNMQMADDSSATDSSQSPSMDNNANGTQSQGNVGAADGTSSPSSDSSNSNDDMSADTATGDDDY
jgi:hypothetical protein